MLMDGYKLAGDNRHDAPDRSGASPRRSVRLPYDFGTVVYHRARTEKIRGLVTRYTITQRGTEVGVMWGDDLCTGWHDFYELCEEYEPIVL